MPHNNRVRSPTDTWQNITRAEFEQLDANIAAGVNGDDGGTWAPTSQIVIAGAGLQLSGPLVVARGGQLQIVSTAGIRLNDGDFPQLATNHVGRSRTVVYPCATGTPLPSKVAWFGRWSDGAMASIAPTIDISDGNGQQPARLLVPIRAHDGATLSGGTVNFRIGWAHTQVPSTLPAARVIAMTPAGAIVPLTSPAAGGDPNGYVYATKPGSAAAWTGQQAISITCDINNVISIAQYSYFVEIVEEQGLTGYPWQLVVAQPAVAHIVTALSGPPFGLGSYDGVTFNDGDRVLVNEPPSSPYVPATAPSVNGIWVAHAGQWSRAPDMQTFSRGMIVPVLKGSTYGGTFWQASTRTASWSPGTQPNNAALWASGTTHAVGDAVVPTTGHATGYWYQATAITGTGTTGVGEPAWTTVVGATVIDNPGANQITWTCMGQATSAVTFVGRGIDDAETVTNAGTEILAHGNIWQSVAVQYTNITQAGFE